MERQKSDRRTKYTKMVLKESLMKLMQQKPLAKITIKELCETADINRCTFYAHYTDQYDLLRQIEDEMLKEVEEMLSNYSYRTDQTEAYQMLERIFIYVAENREICALLLSDQGDAAFQKRLMKIAQHQQVQNWSLKKGMDAETAEYIYLFSVNGSIGLVQSWLKNGLNKSPAEIAEMVTKLTNCGLSAFA